MKTYTLPNSTWARGSGSLLYNQRDGRSCCLGVALLAEGAPIKELESTGAIQSWHWKYSEEIAALEKSNKSVDVPLKDLENCEDDRATAINAAYIINDDSADIPDEHRVELLNDVVRPFGFQFKFDEVG